MTVREVIQETMAKRLEDRDWYSREFAGGNIDLSNQSALSDLSLEEIEQ